MIGARRALALDDERVVDVVRGGPLVDTVPVHDGGIGPVGDGHLAGCQDRPERGAQPLAQVDEVIERDAFPPIDRRCPIGVLAHRRAHREIPEALRVFADLFGPNVGGSSPPPSK